MIASILAATPPDAKIMIKGIIDATDYFFLFARYFALVLSFIWMCYAILNLYSLHATNNGQISKLFPSRSQPTIASAWMQLVISALLFVTMISLLPVATMTSLLTGEPVITVYSVGSYAPAQVEFQDAAKQLALRVFNLIGLLAFLRGFIVWWQMSNGTTDQGFARVLGYWFFGLICFSITFVSALIANTIGFDFLGFIFNR